MGLSGAFSVPDDRLRDAFAACGRCLGAYLCAVDSSREVECPGCGSAWQVRAERPAVVDVPADLDALARWLPTICGRAMPLQGTDGRSAPRLGTRPDHVDEHHRDRRSGLRTALTALSRLDALERAGHRREVRVLWYAYVLCGPELVRMHRGGREDLVAQRFASKEQLAFWQNHKNSSVRHAQMQALGTRLLAAGRAAYEALANGERPRAPEAPAELTADVQELLERTARRLSAAPATG